MELAFFSPLSLLFGWINVAFPVVVWAIPFLVQIFVLFLFLTVFLPTELLFLLMEEAPDPRRLRVLRLNLQNLFAFLPLHLGSRLG